MKKSALRSPKTINTAKAVLLLCFVMMIATFATAQTVVYLPVPNAAIGTIAITNCTNATPIVCTAPNHGLSNGAAVWIQGIAGNTNADGFFQIGSVTTNTFTLANYLYFSNVPAGNGAFASNATVNGVGPSVTPLTAYATVAHPRLLLDGASGPLTASVSNTSTKANTSNPFYKALLAEVSSFESCYTNLGADTYGAGKCGTSGGTGMALYAANAMLWAATGNSSYLTIAKWGVDNFEQIVGGDAYGYGFYCPYGDVSVRTRRYECAVASDGTISCHHAGVLDHPFAADLDRNHQLCQQGIER